MPEENSFIRQDIHKEPKKETKKIAMITLFLTIALTVALVILGERLLYDINRWFNPAHDRFGYLQTIREVLVPTAHATVIDGYTPPDSRQDYETYRLLLHAALIVPLFLLFFLLYYFVHFKKRIQPL